MREIKFRAWDKATDNWLEGVTYILHTSGRLLTTPRDVELMQYTGLKDKAGKDIYEGDILKMEDATAKVVFWERPPEFGLDFYHNEEAWCEDWNLTDDSERMEIIGNVYETPELVKKQEEEQP